MTTLFDIGDEIELTVKAKVDEFTASKNGDCYVLVLKQDQRKDATNRGMRDQCAIYLDSDALNLCNAKLIPKEPLCENKLEVSNE